MSSAVVVTGNGATVVPEKDRTGINPPPGSSSDHEEQQRDVEGQAGMQEDEEELEEPQLSLWMALLTLLIVTVVG
jgi:hypothetical protein